MDRWLASYPPPAKPEDDRDAGKRIEAASRKALKNRKPEETLDLHGHTREEAEKALAAFLSSARRKGLRKVLIIHGKGSHSREGKAVLPGFVRDFLEKDPDAGEFGTADPANGGSGAVWVRIRQRSR